MKIEMIERDSDGKLPSFAWPGGYPLMYVDRDCSTLCADCATKSLDDPDEIERFKPTDGDVYWEGEPVFCDGCNVVIESAYGDPNNDSN